MKVDKQDEDNNSIKDIINDKADDEEHLIEGDSPQPINCITRCIGPARHRLITVEPAMLLLIMAFGTSVNLRGQYLKQKVAESYGIISLPGASTCSNSGNATDITNTSDVNSKIMAEASEWGVYLSVAESIPTLFIVPILGAWSDQIGRKVVMVIPLVGYMFSCLTQLFIMALDLHLNWFFIPMAFQGASGGIGLFISVCLSYIADITTKDKRMFRIVIIDMIFLLGAGVSQIGVGYFLEYAGYVPPTLMSECLVVLAFFYVITPPFLQETVQRRSHSSETPERKKSEVIQSIVALFKNNTDYRRRKLVVSFIATLVIAITISSGGTISLTALFGMGEPFCWSAVEVGYFTASDLACTAIGAFVGGYLLAKCFQDIFIVLLALLDTILSLLVVAVAPSSLFIFASNPIGMLRGLVSPVLKTVVSKIVTENEQGAIFACLGSVQAVGGLLTPVVLNGIYSATVGFCPPFVFYFVIGFLIVPFSLICFLHVLIRNTTSEPLPDLTTPVPEEDAVSSINN